MDRVSVDWNTKDAASGYVTRFRVRSDFLSRHPLRTAGARMHQEYWIPAEAMDDFNLAIDGPIEVVAEFRGKEPA